MGSFFNTSTLPDEMNSSHLFIYESFSMITSELPLSALHVIRLFCDRDFFKEDMVLYSRFDELLVDGSD